MYRNMSPLANETSTIARIFVRINSTLGKWELFKWNNKPRERCTLFERCVLRSYEGKHERFSEQFLGAVMRRDDLLTVWLLHGLTFDVFLFGIFCTHVDARISALIHTRCLVDSIIVGSRTGIKFNFRNSASSSHPLPSSLSLCVTHFARISYSIRGPFCSKLCERR